MTCNRSDRIRLRFGACGDASNLVRGDSSHSNRVFSCLGGHCDRILVVTCKTFLSKKEPVPNLLEDSFQFLASLSLPFSYNLLRLDPFPCNIHAVSNNSYTSMTHLKSQT